MSGTLHPTTVKLVLLAAGSLVFPAAALAAARAIDRPLETLFAQPGVVAVLLFAVAVSVIAFAIRRGRDPEPTHGPIWVSWMVVKLGLVLAFVLMGLLCLGLLAAGAYDRSFGDALLLLGVAHFFIAAVGFMLLNLYIWLRPARRGGFAG